MTLIIEKPDKLLILFVKYYIRYAIPCILHYLYNFISLVVSILLLHMTAYTVKIHKSFISDLLFATTLH